MEQKNAGQELTLARVVRILLPKIHWILAVGLAAAVLVGAITWWVAVPTYSSHTTMYVYTAEPAGSVTNSDLEAAKSYAATCREILLSDRVLTAVCQYVDAQEQGNLTARELKDLVQVSVIEGTQLLMVRAKTASAELSRTIAGGFGDIGPGEITRITGAGGMEIVDEARLPEQAEDRGIIKNTVLALLAGWTAGAVWFLFRGIDTDEVYPEGASEKKRTGNGGGKCKV